MKCAENNGFVSFFRNIYILRQKIIKESHPFRVEVGVF